LHRLVYFIGMLGVLHYLWLVKADIAEPLLYGGILGILLGHRLWWWRTHSATISRSTR
jgi:sulfoxide reductase heme-binding subunit YedZ